MRYSTLTTPIGELMLTADDDGALTGVNLPNRHPDPAGWERDDELLADARRQLTEYFAGERTDVRPAAAARRRAVPAARLGGAAADPLRRDGLLRRDRPRARPRRTASRAVGAANGRNPIAIVVPCHRVIGSNGSLTGYAGGLECKRALLDLEVGRAALV